MSALNGYEVAGRKLRVEYKRVLPAAEREAKEREKAEKAKAEKEKTDQDVREKDKVVKENINLKPEKMENGKLDKTLADRKSPGMDTKLDT